MCLLYFLGEIIKMNLFLVKGGVRDFIVEYFCLFVYIYNNSIGFILNIFVI